MIQRFVIGDLSTVWLVAYVRETEAPNVHVGQALNFSVVAFPDRVFTANITYVATSLDASTRRLLVRAILDNREGVLRPEMFASVTILTGEGDKSPAVPRDAVVYDGKPPMSGSRGATSRSSGAISRPGSLTDR